MYWSRTGSELAAVLWASLSGLWWLGGWSLATHGFHLERRERLLAGFGLGLAGYLWLANLLAHWLSAALSFALAAVLVGALGLAAALPQRIALPDWRDLSGWPLMAAGLALGWVFLRVSQGLAIFDDYLHLPLISTLAAGNIPPRYFVNSEVNFAYHYGFDLLGASLMRLAGLFPWSALDLSKAILWGYAVTLAYLVGCRRDAQTGPPYRPLGGLLLAGLVVFSGGTRYLLLLAPAGLLEAADALVVFEGSERGIGTLFSGSLTRGWSIDGGPPFPYPFAFLSGIGRPLVMAHAGLPIFNVAILLLVWLLVPRAQRASAWIVTAVLFSLWALTWETSYALLAIGLGLAWGLWPRVAGGPRPRALQHTALAMALSIPIALFQGGLLTELARQALSGPGALEAGWAPNPALRAGFSLRWPPAVVSAHLGALPVTSPVGLVLALFELGPVILLTPWITAWAWTRYRAGDWIYGALLLSAWAGFAVPLLVRYRSDTDIPRLSEHSILVWTLFLGLMTLEARPRWARLFPLAAGIGLASMVFSGLVLAGISLTAASRPILSFGIDPLDARVQRDLWDRLPPESEVFDARSWRATALTGRLTRAVTGNLSFGNQPSAAWAALRESPSVAGFLAQGYRFIYVDEGWWETLSEAERLDLSQPCVEIRAEYRDRAEVRFRRMLDLGGCAP